MEELDISIEPFLFINTVTYFVLQLFCMDYLPLHHGKNWRFIIIF